jgi:type II secretion system protein C
MTISFDHEILKKFTGLFSWRISAVTVGISFVLATALSVLISSLLDPVTDVTQARPGSVPIAEARLEFKPKVVLEKKNVDTILERNIFNSEGSLGDETKKANTPQAVGSQIPRTSLPLKLTGVIYPGDPYNGLAMIENTQKKTINSFVVGDIVDADAGFFLEKIFEDKVIIYRDEQKEFIPLDQVEMVFNRRERKAAPTTSSDTIAPIAEGPAPESFKEEGFERRGNEITVTDAYKRDMLSAANMPKILQDAKAEPYMEGGQLQGWRLTRIRENSIYQKMGLQNGDVIMEINGVKLNDAGRAIAYLQQLKNEKSLEIRGQREGVGFTTTVNVQ